MRLAAPALLLGLAACAARGPVPRDASLYADLGGKEGVRRIVSDLIDGAAEDRRTRAAFAGRNLKDIKRKVEAQVCSLTGGPCEYRGRPMPAAHRGLAITEGEFAAFVERLQESLERRQVPRAARNRLLAILAPMRRDIVYK